MVLVILLLTKELKLYVLKSTKIDIILSNVGSSFNFFNLLLKFSLVIIDMVMEGTVSQMLENFRNCFPFFDIK